MDFFQNVVDIIISLMNGKKSIVLSRYLPVVRTTIYFP